MAARILECDRDTVHRYCQRHPALQRVADEQVETMLDVAEGNIRRQVQAGDVETSKWLLRTRGRERGYGDRQEVEHSGRITLADIARAAAGFDES